MCIRDRWKRISTQQGEPVDFQRRRAVFEPTNKAWQAVQVHCDLCNHAEEWCRPPHR